MKILNFKKIEEIMCYDARWMVTTDKCTIALHTQDGISNEQMKEMLGKCKTEIDITKLNASCFYFD